MDMMNDDFNQIAPQNNGGGDLFDFGRIGLPLTILLVSTLSEVLGNTDLILAIFLKLTGILTFVIYVILNWENIIKSLKKLSRLKSFKENAKKQKNNDLL